MFFACHEVRKLRFVRRNIDSIPRVFDVNSKERAKDQEVRYYTDFFAEC